MSEAKFTKENWVIGSHKIKDAEDCNVECNQDCGWSYVGTAEKTVALVVTKSYTDNDIIDNAYLIAAAPDLYEEIEREAAAIRFELEFNKISITTRKSAALKSALSRKEKLLAKARGEYE